MQAICIGWIQAQMVAIVAELPEEGQATKTPTEAIAQV